MLEDAGLDEKFWPEAVRCAAYMLSRIPSYNSSANFRFNGRHDNRKIIRFGRKVIYLDQRPHENTIIKQKGRHGLFMGYNLDSKDYLVWDEEGKMIVNAHVVDRNPQVVSESVLNFVVSEERFQVRINPVRIHWILFCNLVGSVSSTNRALFRINFTFILRTLYLNDNNC